MMNMFGMPMGHGAGTHGGPDLLPDWLGLIWALIFLPVAASHLRHMTHTTGQRRSWHACHVLMAVGMAFMYVPARIDPLTVSADFWQVVFAAAGLIAAIWAIYGVGRVSTLIWLLTSIDLGACSTCGQAPDSGAAIPAAAIATGAAASGSLIGELDISASMVAMTVGMAFMLVATQLMA